MDKVALNPVIAVAGHSASGKTTLARDLAERLGYAFVDIGSIVRQTALDFIDDGGTLQDETGIDAYLGCLNYEARLDPTLGYRQTITIDVNGKPLDINDPRLRQPFLDDETILLAAKLQDRLALLQREVAVITPTVFSVRNGDAFSNDEAVKIFIDPGFSARARRRAECEFDGKKWSDLDRTQKRDILKRVVIKEGPNITYGTSINPAEAQKQGYTIFRNKGELKDNKIALLALTKELLMEKGLLVSLIEGYDDWSITKERE